MHIRESTEADPPDGSPNCAQIEDGNRHFALGGVLMHA